VHQDDNLTPQWRQADSTVELQADIVIGGKKLSPPITGKGISKKGLQCAELTQCLLTH